MKFILKFEKDHTVPCAWCELCDHEITDARTAMVYWREKDYAKGRHEPLLAHKRCMIARPAMDKDYTLSMELWTYFAFLLKNVDLSGPKLLKAKQNAGLVSTDF